MWSDECSAERGKGKKRDWVWGSLPTNRSRSSSSLISREKTFESWSGRRFGVKESALSSSLIDRDFESKKQRVLCHLLHQVLDECALDL